MGRNIVTQSSSESKGFETATTAEPDNYAAQIVKLIPAEIVGVYLGLQNIFAPLADPTKAIVQIVLFLIILGIAPFYLKIVGGITDSRQRMVAVISYCIWSISLGGPFAYFLMTAGSPISAEMIGGALIMLYTLVVPMLYRPKT